MDTTTKKTIILFSGDFDKVMAAFIIANGAAAMGDDVTIFSTFWGLNILRKDEKVQSTAKKSTLQSMFGRMMPKGTRKLGLSKMNFAGMGAPDDEEGHEGRRRHVARGARRQRPRAGRQVRRLHAVDGHPRLQGGGDDRRPRVRRRRRVSRRGRRGQRQPVHLPTTWASTRSWSSTPRRSSRPSRSTA